MTRHDKRLLAFAAAVVVPVYIARAAGASPFGMIVRESRARRRATRQ